MATLLRVKARWAGFPGGPGYSILHFGVGAVGDGGGALADDAAATSVATAVRNFFRDIAGMVPSPVSIQVEPEVELIDSTNGDLIGFATSTPQAIVQGGGAATFSAPSGAVVNWRTAGVRNGRRVRGKTFLVPLTTTAYQADGSLSDNFRSTIVTSANALIADAGNWDIGVFGRPSTAEATDGQFSAATSANVPDMAAMLTSRR